MKKQYLNIPKKNPKLLNYTADLKKNIKIESGRISLPYLIFIYDELKEKYKLELGDFVFLIYLFELGLFRYYIDTGGKAKKSIVLLVKKGFVEKSGNDEEVFYKLSEKGIDFIQDFYYELSNYKKHIPKNRVFDLDVESRSEKIISTFNF